jgi:tetratricopeptide (TPR) repeat protein
VVDLRHLDYVRSYRQKLASWLTSSPGSPINSRLTEAISEIAQVEGRILYSLGRLDEAGGSYQTAIRAARESGNVLLEAIGLAWFSNFLIDTGQAERASAPAEAARRKAEKGGATPLVCAWLASTEADAWSNQPGLYRVGYQCDVALDRAAELMRSVGSEQERYPVLYDHPWTFGYRGTVCAHLGRPREAQSELEQGLAALGPAHLFRQWGYYKDLVIAYSLDKHVDEACHCARQAMNIAEQTKAPMEMQRTQNTAQQFLKPWEESPMVKNLMEEFRVAQRKLALA